jgi:uncharacterized protein (DUF4415 family)
MKKNATEKSYSDWDRIDAMTDKDIDTSEIPPLDGAFFATGQLRLPKPKPAITIRLDPDVLAWYRAQGKGYQTRMNAVLRLYMEAHRHRA